MKTTKRMINFVLTGVLLLGVTACSSADKKADAGDVSAATTKASAQASASSQASASEQSAASAPSTASAGNAASGTKKQTSASAQAAPAAPSKDSGSADASKDKAGADSASSKEAGKKTGTMTQHTMPAPGGASSSAKVDSSAKMTPAAPQTSERVPAKKPAKEAPKPPAKADPAAKSSEETVVVEISNFAFSKDTLTIKAGTKVKFVNRDAIQHSATADDGSFDTDLIAKDDSVVVTFDKAGTFGYHCTPHPDMTATIIVK